MSYRPFFWSEDSEGNPVPIYYDELEADTRKKVIRPVGGFVFPAGAFMAMDLAKAPFIIDTILPKRGKALVYAPTKAGKSFLCLQIARCVGAGEPILGLPTQKGKVLYIQFELGEEILQDRMFSTKQGYDNVWVGTGFDIKLDSHDGQKRVIKAIEVVDPDLLIVDPLYKGIKGDENESQDMMEVLNFLDDVVESGCAVFMTHHAGKDLTKRGRGSSVLEDWVDSYMGMKAVNKKGEPLKIKLDTVYLRHAPLWEEPILAELQNFEFTPVAGALTVKQLVERHILDKKGKVVLFKELVEKKYGSNTALYDALHKLVEEGKIVKKDWGKYLTKGGTG